MFSGEYSLSYLFFLSSSIMNPNPEKPVQIVSLPTPDLASLVCPVCNSTDLVRSHSYLRSIPDLGTKEVRKFLEFESIHLQCQSCAAIFPLLREGIVPGLSVSGAVLDMVLTLYFEFGNSAGMIRRMMEILYSVSLKDKTILKWVRSYGKDYCQQKNIQFNENVAHHSGIIGLDGTFPALEFEEKDETRVPQVKKKPGSCLQLTTLPDGTLLAIWDKAKPNPKSPNF